MSETAFEELTLDLGNMKLAARAHGPADGTPVLALHGWLDNAASFEPLMPLLEGMRVVAPDLPGHAHSDHRPPGAVYHFVDYIADALATADALGWRRFTLLGHSLGGAIGALLAAAAPERVERLALIESLGPLSEESAQAPQRLAQSLAQGSRQTDRAIRYYASVDEAVATRRSVGALSDAAARRLVERGTVTEAQGVCWRYDRRLWRPSPYRLTEDQVLAILGTIHAPTLVIAADDGYIRPDHPVIQQRLAALADGQLHRLRGNHHLHLEDAESVARCVRPFMEGRHSAAG
ncbi:MAG: alpha/beta hydrolase [Halofilum sp. (in: g-proteobacteria)]